PDEGWRATCHDGQAFAGFGKGWLGRARCADGDSYGPSAPILAAVTAAVCVVLAAAVGDHCRRRRLRSFPPRASPGTGLTGSPAPRVRAPTRTKGGAGRVVKATASDRQEVSAFHGLGQGGPGAVGPWSTALCSGGFR